MKLADLTLPQRKITVIHPENSEWSFDVTCHHESSHEFNANRIALSKEKDLTLASVVAESAIVKIDGIDDFDNSSESISELCRNPAYFWIAAQIAEPYLEQKKSLKKG